MAEAQVSLRYRSLPAKVTYYSLMAATPAMLMFLIWFSVVLFAAVTDGVIQAGPACLFAMGQMFFLALMAFALVVCSDSAIFCTRDGISLPFMLCRSLRFRSELPWSSLKEVKLINNGKQEYLALFYEGNRVVKLNLRNLSELDKQQLLVAFEVWAGGTEKYPELEHYRIRLGNAAQALGCTQMWEDELARRFGATNFVPLEPGHSIRNGELQVSRQIAFGGLSAVYLVNKGKEKFILKESVVPSDADDALLEKAAKLFQREAEILSKIDHPAIVRILDHFVENGRNYLLIDFIAGSDLRKLVKEKGAPPMEQVIDWGLQIAKIMNYLHHQPIPIVHRDLTPDNLVLRTDGTIAAIDFGAANEFIGTATGTMIGKQAYIAPEQLRGKASTKSDVYAYACTLHFLLTASDPEPLSVSAPGKFRHEVPEWLNQLVQQCTAMEASERPDSADIIQALTLHGESECGLPKEALTENTLR